MKLNIILSFVIVTLQSVSCTKIDTTDGTPSCVARLIKKDDCVGSVSLYKYDGESTYLFQPTCPDACYILYDDKCNVMCSPSGCYDGDGDGNCTDFNTSAEFVETVWAK